MLIIKGKVTFSANVIATAIRRSGRYDYRVKQLDDATCVIDFTMDGKLIGTSTFTMDDAKKAGLASGDNWRKYPRNMLFARAMSNGAKWFCPDVFGCPVYTPDELGATVDGDDGSVIDVSPEPLRVVSTRCCISQNQRDELNQLIHRKNADAAKLLSDYQVASLSDLTLEHFIDAVGRLSGRPDVQQSL